MKTRLPHLGSRGHRPFDSARGSSAKSSCDGAAGTTGYPAATTGYPAATTGHTAATASASRGSAADTSCRSRREWNTATGSQSHRGRACQSGSDDGRKRDRVDWTVEGRHVSFAIRARRVSDVGRDVTVPAGQPAEIFAALRIIPKPLELPPRRRRPSSKRRLRRRPWRPVLRFSCRFHDSSTRTSSVASRSRNPSSDASPVQRHACCNCMRRSPNTHTAISMKSCTWWLAKEPCAFVARNRRQSRRVL